jgi:TRAP-type C4-dicarboxylate transport system substrate-binding protein
MFISRRIGLLILVLTGMMICAGPTLGASVVFNLGTVDTQQSYSGVGTEFFAKEVERLSNGSMQINVFHAGKLGTIPAQMTNVLNGSQDMHLLYPEFMTTFIVESKVLSLPYLFETMEHLQKFHKSDLWKPAMDRVEGMGGVVIDKEWTWMINDPRGFVSTRPISTPKEMEGMKLRIWESKTAIETWRAFGANTIVIPRPEFYLALKQGIVEGGPETVGIIVDQKSAEVAKFFTVTSEYYQIINLMINKKKYDALTAEQKNILQKAAETSGKFFTDYTRKNHLEKRKRAIEEYGVKILEPPLGPWRERGAVTIARLVKDGYVSEDFINKIRAFK